MRASRYTIGYSSSNGRFCHSFTSSITASGHVGNQRRRDFDPVDLVKVRDEGHIQNKAIYVVLGVNLEGQKEVLGLWVAQTLFQVALDLPRGHAPREWFRTTAF